MTFSRGWSPSSPANPPWTASTKLNDVGPQDQTTWEGASGFPAAFTAGLDTGTIPASPVQTLKAVVQSAVVSSWTCEYSNDRTTWTSAGSQTSTPINTFVTLTWALGGISARYYRISASSGISPGNFECADLRIYDAGNAEITTSGTLTNGAAFLSQVVPGGMIQGEAYSVTIRMQNSGTSTWSEGSAFRLRFTNPDDNATWGISRVIITGTVNPGDEYDFVFNVTAPVTPGAYNLQTQMVQDGTGAFGDKSTNVGVVVIALAVPTIAARSILINNAPVIELTGS